VRDHETRLARVGGGIKPEGVRSILTHVPCPNSHQNISFDPNLKKKRARPTVSFFRVVGGGGVCGGGAGGVGVGGSGLGGDGGWGVRLCGRQVVTWSERVWEETGPQSVNKALSSLVH